MEGFLEAHINKILNEKPDIIGFSIFTIEQLPYSLVLAHILKEKTGLPIIFGGAIMPYIDSSAFLEIFEFVDFVIAREGEIGLAEFIEHFKDKNFEAVSGLIYRRENKIIRNEEKFIQDLDSLPFPDFGDFELEQYFFPDAVLPVFFSRGCFWKC